VPLPETVTEMMIDLVESDDALEVTVRKKRPVVDLIDNDN
jgi:hypothetical protein